MTGWVILCIYLHSFICGVVYKAFVLCKASPERKVLDGSRRTRLSEGGLRLGVWHSTTRSLRIVRYTHANSLYAAFPAILALRLYINRKDGKPDRYLGFMVSHLRPGAWCLECVAMWYRMILSGRCGCFSGGTTTSSA